MPKKKVQHKGQPKHATTESGDSIPKGNISESGDEEYTTVVDYENNKKYSKRLLANNWAKYETEIPDFEPADENVTPKMDDFNFLLSTASSDCSHFQFSSEKQWSSEDNSVPASEIFNLDLNLLSSGLACLPFHKRIGLDENELSEEDKKRFEEASAKSWEIYNPIKENFIKKFGGEGDSSQPSDVVLESKVPESSLEEAFEAKVNLNTAGKTLNELKKDEGSREPSKLSEAPATKSEGIEKKVVSSTKETGSKVVSNTQNAVFSDDENLEDWLDSVLDV